MGTVVACCLLRQASKRPRLLRLSHGGGPCGYHAGSRGVAIWSIGRPYLADLARIRSLRPPLCYKMLAGNLSAMAARCCKSLGRLLPAVLGVATLASGAAALVTGGCCQPWAALLPWATDFATLGSTLLPRDHHATLVVRQCYHRRPALLQWAASAANNLARRCRRGRPELLPWTTDFATLDGRRYYQHGAALLHADDGGAAGRRSSALVNCAAGSGRRTSRWCREFARRAAMLLSLPKAGCGASSAAASLAGRSLLTSSALSTAEFAHRRQSQHDGAA
jgi:hypothetical protein